MEIVYTIVPYKKVEFILWYKLGNRRNSPFSPRHPGVPWAADAILMRRDGTTTQFRFFSCRGRSVRALRGHLRRGPLGLPSESQRFRGRDGHGTRGQDARDTNFRCSTKVFRQPGGVRKRIFRHISASQIRERIVGPPGTWFGGEFHSRQASSLPGSGQIYFGRVPEFP